VPLAALWVCYRCANSSLTGLSPAPLGRERELKRCGVLVSKAAQNPAPARQSTGDSQLPMRIACVQTGGGLRLLDPIGGEHCKITEVHDAVTGDVFHEQRIGLQPCVHEHDQVFDVNDIIIVEVATLTDGR